MIKTHVVRPLPVTISANEEETDFEKAVMLISTTFSTASLFLHR